MVGTFQIQSAKMTILNNFIHQLLHIGWRISIQKCELIDSFAAIDAHSLPVISPDVTNTWALQGDVLGSMTPSRRSFWIVSSLNSRFTADWRLDFVTTGVQFVVKCAKSLGVIFVLTLLSTPRESGGLLPPILFWRAHVVRGSLAPESRQCVSFRERQASHYDTRAFSSKWVQYKIPCYKTCCPLQQVLFHYSQE